MTNRPTLRADLVVRRIVTHNEAYIIVKDPETQSYYKFADWEEDLLALLDGTRDIGELAKDFQVKRPDVSGNLQWMVDHVEMLYGTGLIEKTQQERHLVMMDKLRTLRKRRFYDAEKSTSFQIYMPLFDPDKMLNRIIPWIRWWWSPWFVIPSVVVSTVVIVFLLAHLDFYMRGFMGLWSAGGGGAAHWLGLLLLILGVSVWHELGHGFTCKRYGGEVHDMGFMFLYFQPAFYCGVDDAYLFPKQSHRMYATFGGAYFELMLCSIACGAWLATPAEWWIHDVSLSIVFFTGLSLLAFNINPLIRLDGYFVLMDWLEVPGLREESFRYIGNLVRKHILHVQVPEPAISRRRRRIYLIYGLISLTYTALIIYLIFSLFGEWLVSSLGFAGYPIFVGILGYAFRRRFRDLGRFGRHLWLDKKDLLLSGRGRIAAGTGVAGLIVFLTVPSFATRIEGSFTVMPGERVVVHASGEGIVRSLTVREGDAVRQGQVLAILENGDLEAERVQAESDMARLLREAAQARGSRDIAGERERIAELGEARSRFALVARRLELLTLEAPIQGVVATPNVEAALGRLLVEGEELCVIHRLDTVNLDVRVAESNLGEIQVGTPVRVHATAWPWKSLNSSVLSIAPIVEPPRGALPQMPDLVPRVNLVRTEVRVDNGQGALRPGMTGKVQFRTRPRSIAMKIWRTLSFRVASLIW